MAKVASALVVALILAGFVVNGVVAAAEDAPKLGIRPVIDDGSYFTLTIPAGERQEVTFELGNFGTTKTRAISYPADVYTLFNGGFGARLDGDPVTGVTTWLDYERETLTLKPGKATRRTIVVEVPKKTAPGEYITSLVIQNAKPIAGTGTFAIDQIVRQAIAVAITVPGPRQPGLAIGEAAYTVEGGVTSLGVTLTNTGNVHLKPAGDFVVRDAAGAIVLETPVAMDSFYAGMSTLYRIGLQTPFADGAYTLHLKLGDERLKLKDQTKELSFTVATAEAETAAAPAVSPVTVGVFDVTPTRDTANQTLQFVTTALTIENSGEDIPNTRVTLHVTRDGEPVEDFVLGSAMTLVWGQSKIEQRYIPAGGWTPGVYTFAVTVEQVDPATGAVVALTTAEAATTITVSE